ncbi:heterokaryon incompatibility protein-domain-containing protein [Xylaria curta]|nr:heterokaryon incompatibility protein-domain-containing protein [Xylaria curta]
MEGSEISPLSNPIVIVSLILEDLSGRDSRFNFIRESFEEFLYGDSGVREVEKLVFTPESDGKVGRYRGPDNNDYFQYLFINLSQIVHTTIYEILNVFDIDITLEQALMKENDGQQRFWEDRRISLLEALNKRSKELVPKPAQTVSTNLSTSGSQEIHDYQYPSRLRSPNIRVLCIQPSSQETPIECQLEERSLDSDTIEEALSYVWGKPIFDRLIKVDGKAFCVTSNLHNILYNLRHLDVTRTIWIDAICINQSDLEEKGHQVLLMRDIFSKAQKTIIWLGNGPTEQMMLNFTLDSNIPDNLLTQVPEGVEGYSMERYDLAAILQEFLEYQKDSIWDEKHCALAVMLVRCMNIIMVDEWWERVWTIQEAALPSNEPIIHFRGYYFSYSTVISALDAVAGIEAMVFSDFPTPTTEIQTLYSQLKLQVSLQFFTGRDDAPFIRQIRPEKRKETSISNLRDRLLGGLLELVSGYRATDPRDKIFALESLLPRSVGRLINVNYNESTEAVFRRTTAQLLNLVDIRRYSLLIECQNSRNNTHSGPSWVHDFSYTDPASRNFIRGKTLRGFLLNHDSGHPFVNEHSTDEYLATPRTFFCSGIPVDIIYYIELVPDLTKANSEDLSQFLKGAIQRARQKRAELVIAGGLPKPQMQDPMTDNTVIRDGEAAQSIDQEAGGLGKGYQIGQRTFRAAKY